jgi:hypothetical protein
LVIVTAGDDCDQRHDERDGSTSSNPSTGRFVDQGAPQYPRRRAD